MKLKNITKVILLLVVMFTLFGLTSVKAATREDLTFNSNYYYNKYGDLRKAFGNDSEKLKNHFLTFGIKEGRVASATFDVKYYLNRYGDLQKAFGKNNYQAAYNHFLKFGIKEGRAGSATFDVRYYLNKYPDLQRAFGKDNYEAAYNHYLTFGIKEGRTSAPNFDVRHYLARYGDLQKAFGNDYAAAYNHYLTFGIREGRNASAEHIFVEEITKEATCEEAGSKTLKCRACGYTETAEIPALNHEFEFKETITPATCTTKGLDVNQCTRCGKAETVETATIDHDCVVTEEVKATCKVAGKQVLACKNCDYVGEKTLEIDTENGHNFVKDNTASKVPTCGEDGVRVEKCSICEEVKETPVPATEAHDWVKDAKKSVAPTCNADGVDVYECSVCKATKSEPNTTRPAHSYVTFGAEEAGTCKDGKISKICSVCGYQVIDEVVAGTHNWNEVKAVITKEATCGEAGSKTVTCDDCGATKEVEIPATGNHKFAHDEADPRNVKPTCQKDGTKVAKCSVCGETVLKTWAKSEEFHAYDEGEVTTPATCEKDGVRTFKCTVEGCKAEKTEAITKLGHKYVNAKGEEGYVKAPTCTEDGNAYCGNERCANYYKNKDVAPMTIAHPVGGHDWNDWVVVTEATAENVGKKVHTCKVCHAREDETIPKLETTPAQTTPGQTEPATPPVQNGDDEETGV